MTVIANVEMAKAWDGEEGERWAKHAEKFEAGGVRFESRLLDAAAIAPADRILDIGCGTGQSTRDAARRAKEGAALGVDLSSQMLHYARDRASGEGLTNVEFLRADAQVHRFDEASHDVAISSFGAMFFGDPVAAFSNIASALRPGGRLAMLAWQDLEENEWLMEVRGALAVGRSLPRPPAGAPGPFGLAEPGRVREILGAAGFESIAIEPVREQMWFGADADDAWSFFRVQGIVKGLTEDLDAAARDEAMASLRRMIEAHATADGVQLGGAAWLISASRA